METNFPTVPEKCKKCNKIVQAEQKISKSEKNPGKLYLQCPECDPPSFMKFISKPIRICGTPPPSSAVSKSSTSSSAPPQSAGFPTLIPVSLSFPDNYGVDVKEILGKIHNELQILNQNFSKMQGHNSLSDDPIEE